MRHFLSRLLFSVCLWFAIPAIIIKRSEEENGEPWTFSEALYYCFITLTTIGYGDYMAWGHGLSPGSPKQISYFVFIELWKIAGLVMVGLVTSRLAEKVASLFPPVTVSSAPVTPRAPEVAEEITNKAV